MRRIPLKTKTGKACLLPISHGFGLVRLAGDLQQKKKIQS